VQEIYDTHINDSAREHTVQPKLVYISNPTEIGTIYTKAELTALSHSWRKKRPSPSIWTARTWGTRSAPSATIWTSRHRRALRRVFYRRHKNGALFGEALVITNESLKPVFPLYHQAEGRHARQRPPARFAVYRFVRG
jgi:threonine aldolase